MLTPKKKDTGVVVTKNKRDTKGIAAERAKGNTVYIPKAAKGGMVKKAMPKKAMGGKMGKKAC
jgi:hypothetical protein